MKTLNITNNIEKNHNIEYFIHLIRVALADNIICDEEVKLLNRLGKKLSLTDQEINHLIETTSKSDYIPPFELFKRFEQVYSIVKMTLADGVIDKNEMQLASVFAAKSNFSESEIPAMLVLIISGIREGKDEEVLFEEYKKRKKIIEKQGVI